MKIAIRVENIEYQKQLEDPTGIWTIPTAHGQAMLGYRCASPSRLEYWTDSVVIYGASMREDVFHLGDWCKCSEPGCESLFKLSQSPHDARSRDQHICPSCCFWWEVVEDGCLVIDGHAYSVGAPGTGGMGGRLFRILNSQGKEIVTNSLWSRGTVPDHFRDRLQDNAIFLGGAGKVDAGGNLFAFNSSYTFG